MSLIPPTFFHCIYRIIREELDAVPISAVDQESDPDTSYRQRQEKKGGNVGSFVVVKE